MKLIGTLRFSDGQCVIAIMQAETPKDECPIDYQGAVDRLTWRPEAVDPLGFKVMFRSLACEHRAQLEFQEEGDYAASPKNERDSKFVEPDQQP